MANLSFEELYLEDINDEEYVNEVGKIDYLEGNSKVVRPSLDEYDGTGEQYYY